MLARRAEHWQARMEDAMRSAGRGTRLRVSDVLKRAVLFNEFRSVHADFVAERREERESRSAQARLVEQGLIALIVLVFVVFGYVMQVETRRRNRHARFSELMQASRSESEAYLVLTRHLERLVAGSQAVVLNRNNSANRLEPRTPAPEGWEIGEQLESAQPESCLAIRTGRPYQRSNGGEELLPCEVCSCLRGRSTCVPSLVGGEVIGSVLIEHRARLDLQDARRLRAVVGEAAPVVANLRNLALAQARAATDALTGLANKREAEETLKRMIAQAGRMATSLAAVLFDLDHFKQINDTWGHGKGDEVLSAVADAAMQAVRASDFVARYGGEEFLILLPATNRHGAVQTAEKVRAAIAAVNVREVNRPITASFGVAVYPDDSGDAGELIRNADRALYAAKAGGRDRTEVVVPNGSPVGEPH
jgi:diguanylate cyclase (GGDEF)-like protein